MATGGIFSRLYNKKVLALSAFKDQLFDYLRSLTEDAVGLVYDRPTVLQVPVEVRPSGEDPNTISVGHFFESRVMTNGKGRIIRITGTPSELHNIKVPWEEGNGEAMMVGLRSCLVEDGVETNPRTGELEYSRVREDIGDVAEPGDVIDNGNDTLTFDVTSFFDAPRPSQAGRRFRVWLKPRSEGGIGPKLPLAVDAFQTAAATYDGTGVRMLVTIDGTLGQGTLPSTDAAMYRIQALGPRITYNGNINLSEEEGTVFLGIVYAIASGEVYVDGDGNFDITGQRVASFSLADMATVLRRDSHGSVKVRVKADNSDNGENQLEVQASNSVTRWLVTETGETRVIDSSSIVRARLRSSGGASVEGVGSTGNRGVDGTGSAGQAGVRGTGGTNAPGVQGVGSGTGAGVEGTASSAANPAFKAVTGYVDALRLDSAGALKVGDTAGTSLALGRPGADTTISGQSVSINSSSTGNVNIDAGATRNLDLGRFNSESVNIGRSGKPVGIYGPTTHNELDIHQADIQLNGSSNYKWGTTRTRYHYVHTSEFLAVSGGPNIINTSDNLIYWESQSGVDFIIVAQPKLPVGALVTDFQILYRNLTGSNAVVRPVMTKRVQNVGLGWDNVSFGMTGAGASGATTLPTGAGYAWLSMNNCLVGSTAGRTIDETSCVFLKIEIDVSAGQVVGCGGVRIGYTLDTIQGNA